MGLFKRRTILPSDDVDQALELRAEARQQRSMLAGAARFLSARSDENGFGDELQVTWTPRREEFPDHPRERHA